MLNTKFNIFSVKPLTSSVKFGHYISLSASLHVAIWLRVDYHSACNELQSMITETHVVDTKTKMYFMHGDGKFTIHCNEQSHLYRHVFATDREQGSDCFMNNRIEWASVIICTYADS